MAESTISWQNQLDPSLVGRLTQPLYRPGVIRADLAQTIQGRFQGGTVSSNAIATQLIQRRQLSTSPSGPAMPLVYAQRLPVDSVGEQRDRPPNAALPIQSSNKVLPRITPNPIPLQSVQQFSVPIGTPPPREATVHSLSPNSGDRPFQRPKVVPQRQSVRSLTTPPTPPPALPASWPAGRQEIQRSPMATETAGQVTQSSTPKVSVSPVLSHRPQAALTQPPVVRVTSPGRQTIALQRQTRAIARPTLSQPALIPQALAPPPRPVVQQKRARSPSTGQQQTLAPTPAVEIQRQAAPLPMVPFQFSESAPASKPKEPLKATSPAPAMADGDDRVDQTLRQLARRLTIEQERRGGQPWF